MELALANTAVSALVDLDTGTSTEAFGRFLDSQRELLHAQIDHLQRIVLAQCKLTGVNPLSQEMAAGALSIKIGKRPRDLLNPKAIKYMQSVFSIKDTIGKKETREISAICGATITQVREFFAGQRSRVRKLVRLSREKAVKLDDCKPVSNDCLFIPSSSISVSQHVPLNSVDNNVVEECAKVQVNTHSVGTALEEKQIPANTVPIAAEHASCSSHDDTILGINSDDKIFLENIFNLMRKEETFSGQVKLMEWVLQINDSAILYWFLTRGGISILATWLSQAALEEQTTMILVIFKVLCHLPLHKALPAQISAILQSVNKLRFYRTSDISNKARFLLSRWSKLFVRSQNMKRSSAMNASDAQKERFRKQRISEILSDKSWRSKLDIPGDILAIGVDASENSRDLESKPILKLLPASYDNPSRKDKRTVSSTKTKERRKVLMVEQPDRTSTARSATVVRTVPSNISRPISADDIQKAKMRAIFMQDKYGKDTAANEKCLAKINDPKVLHGSPRNMMLPTPKSSNLGDDEDKNHVLSAIESSQEIRETPKDSKTTHKSNAILVEMLKHDQILWQRPPEVRIFCEWRVGTGENSKEVEVQTQRNQRENETFYLNAHDIPSDPKDPWDIEMDFDDSLTPEIPAEQPPEADAGDVPSYEGGAELSPCPPSENMDKAQVLPAAATVPPVGNGALEPDLELLAVLLKNPDLVFALTAGQGSGMNNAQTVALLDMLKNSGAGKVGILNGMAGSSGETPEPTSLPSPTPPVERVRTGWRQEPEILDHIPLLQPLIPTNGAVTTVSPVLIPSHPPAMLLGNAQDPPILPNLILPQAPKAALPMSRMTANLNPSSLQTSDINLVNRKSLPMNDHVSAGLCPPPGNINHETVVSNKQFNFVSPSGISYAHQLEAVNVEQVHNHNSPSFSNISSFQSLNPTPMAHQPLLTEPHLSEPHRSFRSVPPSALPIASDLRLEPVLESWTSHQNGLVDASASSYRVQTNEDCHGAFLMGPEWLSPLFHESISWMNEFDDKEEFGNSSADRSSGDLRSIRSYPELGTRFSQNDRMDRSWLNGSGHRNHHKSGRRWRNRDDDYRR